MQIVAKNTVSRLLLLILTLSLILSSLSSCRKSTNDGSIKSKEEILSSVSASLEDGKSNHTFVREYLAAWGVPAFDQAKFQYLETRVIILFNYSEMPEAEAHAAATVEAFISEYYDSIDLSDKTAVTDSLLDCYVDALGDPYAIYRVAEATDEHDTNMSGKFGGIGVLVQYDHDKETLMISQVYQGSPAEAAGAQVGDYIVGVDGRRVEEIGYLHAVDHVRGKIGTTVSITLLRGDKEIEITAVRGEVEEINVSYQTVEIDGQLLGYVEIASFKSNTAEQFKEAIDSLETAGVEGIIFDMRNNLGGYVSSARDVISYLVPTGKTVVTYQYKNQLPSAYVTRNDGNVDHTVELPMVVITNEYTASAAEIFTAAIRDYNVEGILDATIVGTTTYKKGVMQNAIDYPIDGSTITLTIAYYAPPSGVNFHGTGITPDVLSELPEPVFDEEAGKYLPVHDTQLDTAIEELKKLINVN